MHSVGKQSDPVEATRNRPVPRANDGRNMFEMIVLLRDIERDLLETARAGFREEGDVYEINIVGQKYVMIAHPEHLHEMLVEKADVFAKDSQYTDARNGLARFLGEGLLTANGEFWKRQRRLIAPKLHARRIAGYAEMMIAETEAMLSRWQSGQNGQTLDIDHEMMNTTLHIVTRTLFHLDISDDAERIANAMTVLQEMAAEGNTIEAMIPEWLPTPKKARQTAAVRDLDEIVYRLIREWREKGEDDGSLLSMLLLAETEDGQRMSDKQARDEIVTMFLAGHETTANTMNWTWYLLSQHPDVEARLHEEVDRVLGGRAPTLEDLKQLPYTEQVIKEAMRLYPPAYGFSRVAVEDTTIGGYDIAAGTVLQALTWTTHTDARWWDAPSEFRPERFAPENAERLVRYAYLPFGGGPRVCIGNTFAMMEAQIMLAMIASRYRLRLAPGQQVVPNPMLTLRPKYGLKMVAERR